MALQTWDDFIKAVEGKHVHASPKEKEILRDMAKTLQLIAIDVEFYRLTNTKPDMTKNARHFDSLMNQLNKASKKKISEVV